MHHAPASTRPARRRAPLWLAMTLGVFGCALAQPGLYGPEAPAEVAWVRVLNASDVDGVAVRVAEHAELVIAFGSASGYAVVRPGPVVVDLAGTEIVVRAAPESFTTVAATAAGPVVVHDPGLRDASRGLLGLVNLTARPTLDLRAPDGSPVVERVAPGAHAAVAIARARTGLVVTEGAVEIAWIDAHDFERGVAYTIAVVETDDGPRAYLLSSAAD